MKIRPAPRWKDAGTVLAVAGAAALASGALAAGVQVAPPALAAPRSRTINLSFYNANLVDVMRAISLQSGLGVVVGSTAGNNKVTVRLLNVTVEEAMRMVTQAAGVGYRRAGNTYLVASIEEVKRGVPPASATTYALKGIQPEAAKTLIEASIPSVSVQAVAGVPAVIITGSEADVREAERLLSLADVAPPAPAPVSEVIVPKNIPANLLAEILAGAAPGVAIVVRGNTVTVSGPPAAVQQVRTLLPGVDVPGGAGRRIEVYNIKYSSAQALITMLTSAMPNLQATPSAEPYAPLAPQFQPLTGAAFTSSSGDSGASGGGSSRGSGASATQIGQSGEAGSANVKSRALILSGSDEDIQQALRLLDTLDVAPIQIEIEARLVDVTLDNNFQLGIQWGAIANNAPQTSTTLTEVPADRTSLNAFRFGRFSRSSLTIAQQLRFLETKGRSKTLANPHISVIDNEDASIFIGDILRFETLATTSATAGSNFTVQEVPVGIALLVRPRVNANGEITMKVKPVVSSLTSTSPSGLPQTSSREADTTLRIRDGETIIIGGLISDSESKTMQEVPFLSKLPILGELFRNRINTKRRSEVVLFLTPRLLRNNGAEAASATESALPDEMRIKPFLTEPPEAPKR